MKAQKDFRWFERLTLPVRVRGELQVDAAKREHAQAARVRRAKREAEARFDAEQDARREPPPVAAPAVDHGAALKIGRLTDGVVLFDEEALRAAYRKIKTVATADRERTKSRVALIEHIATRGLPAVKADRCRLADLPSGVTSLLRQLWRSARPHRG